MGYQSLADAMIRQAAADAKAGDVLAKVWLLDPGYDLAVDLCGLGVSFERWRAWVVAGCPSQRALMPTYQAAWWRAKRAKERAARSERAK